MMRNMIYQTEDIMRYKLVFYLLRKKSLLKVRLKDQKNVVIYRHHARFFCRLETL
jgi:hypothetical protein